MHFEMYRSGMITENHKKKTLSVIMIRGRGLCSASQTGLMAKSVKLSPKLNRRLESIPCRLTDSLQILFEKSYYSIVRS